MTKVQRWGNPPFGKSGKQSIHIANTFTQIYIQVVFAVKGRDLPISLHWEDGLFRYIRCIVQSKGQKMLAINGASNQIHYLLILKKFEVDYYEKYVVDWYDVV